MLVLLTISAGATAAIAAAASVAAAMLAAFASYSVARIRLREVRLTYDQKLRDSYLATARTYTNSVYVPLSMALTALSTAFSTFRGSFAPDHDPPAEDADRFTGAVREFLNSVAALTERGADAFLTTALEDALISFATFLSASLVAREPRSRFIFEYRISLAGVSAATAREGSGEYVPSFNQIRLRLPGVRVNVRTDRLLAAPITSPEFERRIVQDLAELKTLIKEVTLGAHTSPQ